MSVKRRVVENLRPALLDHFGLPTALQAYFDETCAKAGLEMQGHGYRGVLSMSAGTGHRAVSGGQESLTNIIRHAAAQMSN